MNYLPIFSDVRHKKIIIAGGGQVALSKLRVLLKTTAKIEVYASSLHHDILSFHQQGKLKAVMRPLRQADLAHAHLVYATFSDIQQNAKIVEWAKQKNIWVNVVDMPELSDFISPAIVDRDPVIMAIGTEGTAPMLARHIKAFNEAVFAPSIGRLAAAGGKFRKQAEKLPAGKKRKDFWSKFYHDIGMKAYENHGEDSLLPALHKLLDSTLNDQDTHQGFVYFVGGGPGDPELLTLKARKFLHDADIVLYDGLMNDEILELTRKEAILVNLNMRKYGKSWTQSQINELMVKYALMGHSVVRLIYGDPSLYAYLDEEIEALENANIAFQIIPGVASQTSHQVNSRAHQQQKLKMIG